MRFSPLSGVSARKSPKPEHGRLELGVGAVGMAGAHRRLFHGREANELRSEIARLTERLALAEEALARLETRVTR